VNQAPTLRRGLDAASAFFAKAILVFLLILFTVMTVYPVIWLLVSSLKTTQEFQMNRIGLPKEPTLRNYPMAWKIGDFSTLFVNSLIYTGATTIAIVVISFSAAFAFAKIRSRAIELGLALGEARIVDPKAGELHEQFAKAYTGLRAHKGMTLERARDSGEIKERDEALALLHRLLNKN